MKTTNKKMASMLAIIALLLAVMGSVAQTITIYTLSGTPGGNSISAMVQGRDGELYGTTQSDGKNNAGTVFKVTTGGNLVTLHNFCSKTSCTDGTTPSAGAA
jgi:uncharacterized repeat protein (TIGR03803 family)